MTFFSEANDDAFSVAPEVAATGPRVGFLESFATGWQEQVRASALYGIENQMWELDNEQIRSLRQAGVENVPALSPDSMGWFTDRLPGPAAGVDKYLDTARFYTDGGDPAFANQLEDYDKRVDELRKEYPQLNLRTSREMWDTVKAKAQEYENKANTDRRTFGGEVGMFLGGAAASMNPNTDPLNFVTAGVGGAGRSIATRIAGQAGAQGFIEGVNQLTGVQEQRRLLGVNYGLGDAVSRVAMTAAGGAVLQGLGEGVAAGARRWFRSTPQDTAPMPTPEALDRPPLPDTSAVPPGVLHADDTVAAAQMTREPALYERLLQDTSPLSRTPAGRARTVLDLDYVTERLEDWNGEAPWALAPKMDTAVTLPRSDFVAPDLRPVAERSTVDDLARRVDPDTFAKYDAFAGQKRLYREEIEAEGSGQNAQLQARIDGIDNRIYELAAQADEQTGRRAAKLRKDIKSLEAEKAQVVNDSRVVETPRTAELRAKMMAEDERMRNLTPLVSRAYARARQKWTNTAEDRQAITDMVREGRATARLPDEQAARVLEATEATLHDRAPILRNQDAIAGKLKVDADAADQASAIVGENMKVLDEAVEQYRASLDVLLKSEPNAEIEINGTKYKLNLDKETIVVPNEEGTGGREVTVRQLLQENKLDEYELEAVSSCSLRKTS